MNEGKVPMLTDKARFFALMEKLTASLESLSDADIEEHRPELSDKVEKLLQLLRPPSVRFISADDSRATTFHI
jgi:hypothetical protein